MIRKFWVSKTERVFKISQIVGSFLLLILGGALKADPKDYQDWKTLQDLFSFNQKYSFLIIPGLTVIVGTASYFKTHFGSLNTWNTATHLLEEYKKAIFEKVTGIEEDPEFFHRITLYKYVRFRWCFCWFPWTGWMVPVARTGHTTHSFKIPRFRAPTSEPDRAEGVAGQAFVRRRIVPSYDLPELNEASSDAEKAEYAKKGFVSLEWIKKRKNCHSRALLGIPIEVKGKPWGVIVIDSRRPGEISSKDILTSTQFKTLAGVLGKLLEN